MTGQCGKGGNRQIKEKKEDRMKKWWKRDMGKVNVETGRRGKMKEKKEKKRDGRGGRRRRRKSPVLQAGGSRS